jgi:hypothetical protein
MPADKRSEVTNGPLFETLKIMQASIARRADDMREVKERLGILAMQYAPLSNRFDRLDQRVDRIERRRGLVEV